MSNPVPGLFGSSQQVRYPFTRTVSFLTKIVTNMDESEQRWVTRPPLTQFIVPLNSIITTDRDAYNTWFAAIKGQFAQNITLTLGSTTYSNLTLMSDHLNMVTPSPKLYSTQFEFRQVKNGSYTPPGTVPTAFPSIATGVVAQHPFTTETSFLTHVVDMPAGPRYAYANYAAGLTNMPTGPVLGWHLKYPILTDAQVSTLETFFLGVQGRYASFDFTDPTTNTLYHHVRLDTDTLTLKYDMFGQTSTELNLIQTNNS